jgi:hypothetical protein
MLIKLYFLRSWRVVRRKKIYGNLCQKVAAWAKEALSRWINFMHNEYRFYFSATAVMYGLLQNVSIWIFRAWISFHFFSFSITSNYLRMVISLTAQSVRFAFIFFLLIPLMVCWFSVANWIYYFWLFYCIVMYGAIEGWTIKMWFWLVL